MLFAASLFFLFSTSTYADKKVAEEMVEVMRVAVDSLAKQDVFKVDILSKELEKHSTMFPVNTNFRWSHRDRKTGKKDLCGGDGGVKAVQWILSYMVQTHNIKSVQVGTPRKGDFVAWNILSGEDGMTRRASIRATFDANENLMALFIVYDHKSRLV